jgi:hypothetical protein
MKSYLGSALFALVLTSSVARSDEPVAARVSARFGDTETSSGYKQVFVYSREKISSAQIALGESQTWSPTKVYSHPEFQVVGSESYFEVKDGQKFRFRAVLENGTRFTDTLVVNKADNEFAFVATFEGIESKEAVTKELEELAKKLQQQSLAAQNAAAANINSYAPVQNGRFGGSYKDCWDYVMKTGGIGQAVGTYRRLDSSMLSPGTVLHMKGFSWNGSSGSNHWARVESVDGAGNVTISHSNLNGYRGKIVETRPASGFSGTVTIHK